MTIFWKLTRSPTLAFFGVAIVGLFLASSIQQSLGLECYRCLYDKDVDLTAPPSPVYHKDCVTPTPDTPTEICNDTSKYCVKKYVEVTYEGDTTGKPQTYMSRECSGSDPLPNLDGQTLPVCFKVPGSIITNATVAPANKKLLSDGAPKAQGKEDYNLTTISHICVCNAKDKCNAGPGGTIDVPTDGGDLTTVPPTEEDTEGTVDTDIKEVGDGVGLVRPALYFLLPAVPFFLASYVLRSSSAGANI